MKFGFVRIYINRHPRGYWNNVEFAVCQLLDGLIRVFSLGILASTFSLDQTRRSAKRSIEEAKKRREKEKNKA